MDAVSQELEVEAWLVRAPCEGLGSNDGRTKDTEQFWNRKGVLFYSLRLHASRVLSHFECARPSQKKNQKALTAMTASIVFGQSNSDSNPILIDDAWTLIQAPHMDHWKDLRRKRTVATGSFATPVLFLGLSENEVSCRYPEF